MGKQELYQYWQEVKRYFQLSKEESNRLFQKITNAYQQSGRCYHNIEHIAALVTYIDDQDVSKEERITLLLAAFYHDLVYLPGSKSNEERSAQLLEVDFALNEVNPELIATASRIIQETQNHESTEGLSQLFLDMDVSILGADPDRYLKYCAQIRREFQNIPEFLYRKGRKRFVEQMLAKPFIFQTNKFRILLEKQAIYNLSEELKRM